MYVQYVCIFYLALCGYIWKYILVYECWKHIFDFKTYIYIIYIYIYINNIIIFLNHNKLCWLQPHCRWIYFISWIVCTINNSVIVQIQIRGVWCGWRERRWRLMAADSLIFTHNPLFVLSEGLGRPEDTISVSAAQTTLPDHKPIHSCKRKNVNFTTKHTRMISEDWSNDAENSAAHHRNKWQFTIFSHRNQLF